MKTVELNNVQSSINYFEAVPKKALQYRQALKITFVLELNTIFIAENEKFVTRK